MYTTNQILSIKKKEHVHDPDYNVKAFKCGFGCLTVVDAVNAKCVLSLLPLFSRLTIKAKINDDGFFVSLLENLVRFSKKDTISLCVVDNFDPSVFGEQIRFTEAPYYPTMNTSKLKYLHIRGCNFYEVTPNNFPKTTWISVYNYQRPSGPLFVDHLTIFGSFDGSFEAGDYPVLKSITFADGEGMSCNTWFSLPRTLKSFEVTGIMNPDTMECVRDTIKRSYISKYIVPGMKKISVDESTTLSLTNDLKFAKNRIRNSTLVDIHKKHETLRKKRETMKK